jgi:hypothetical protein
VTFISYRPITAMTFVAEALSNTTGWVLYDRIVEIDEIGGVFGTGHAHGVEIVEGLTRT